MLHLDNDIVVQYLVGIMPHKGREDLENHLQVCDACGDALRKGYGKVIQKCAEMRTKFGRYYDEMLDDQEMDEVSRHLMFCDWCLKDYDEIVVKKELN